MPVDLAGAIEAATEVFRAMEREEPRSSNVRKLGGGRLAAIQSGPLSSEAANTTIPRFPGNPRLGALAAMPPEEFGRDHHPSPGTWWLADGSGSHVGRDRSISVPA